MFNFFKKRRRKKIIAKAIEQKWIDYLEEDVPFFRSLEGKIRKRFLDHLKIFVAEKDFVTIGDLELNERMMVVIAATAVRLTLFLDIDYYDRLNEIIIYQGRVPQVDDEDNQSVLGSLDDWGTLKLSWDSVLGGLSDPKDGHDVATHEFAHVLDLKGGAFDGTPRLKRYACYAPWAKTMGQSFLALRANKRFAKKVINQYGATNEAEFFAVATESFFEKSKQMQNKMPELYDLLKNFYGWDPASEIGSEEN